MTVPSTHPANMRVEKECTPKEKQYLLYMKSLKCTKVQKSIKLNDSVYVWELKYSWRDFYFLYFIFSSFYFSHCKKYTLKKAIFGIKRFT